MNRAGFWLVGAAFMAVGCGLTGPTTTGAMKAKAPTPAPVKATPVPADNQAIARQLAARADAAFAKLETFKAEVRTMEVDPHDGDVYRAAADVAFKSPARFRLIVLPGSHNNVGLKLMFDEGSDHVVVRPGGMLGFARIQLGVEDTRVQSAHGWPLMKISQKGILTRLSSPQSSLAYLGETEVEGKKVDVVAITGPTLLPGVTEERVYLDRTSLIPLRGEMRKGKQIVFSTTLGSLTPNASLPSDAFDI